MKLEDLQKLTTEDLYKMTVKQLIALYEEMTEEPIGFTPRNKEHIVRVIKQHIRAKSRSRAFRDYA